MKWLAIGFTSVNKEKMKMKLKLKPLLVGSIMLLLLAVCCIVTFGREIGFRQTCGAFVVAVVVASWSVAAAYLISKGLNR